MAIGDQIRLLRESRKWSQEDLAQRMGYKSRSSINKIELGRSDLPQSKVLEFARLFGVSPSFLICENSETNEETSSQFSYPEMLPVTTRRVPILGGAACGEPVYEPGDGTEYTTVEGDMPCDFALIAQGDSMTGDRIYSGDVVYFVHADDVADGQIAAVAVDDGVSIKRIKRLRAADGSVLFTQLLSSNPAFNSIDIGGPDETRDVHIIGKAVAFKGKLNQ